MVVCLIYGEYCTCVNYAAICCSTVDVRAALSSKHLTGKMCLYFHVPVKAESVPEMMRLHVCGVYIQSISELNFILYFVNML